MPGNYNYEYAVIRLVPRVERAEFINVGIVLYCQQTGFLATRIAINETRLLALFPGTDLALVHRHLSAFERIASGEPDAGPIARLETASRFRWLTACRSTIVQASAVHPGICQDPQQTLDNLFRQLVLPIEGGG